VSPGAHPFVVLSHDYWQRRFAGASDAVGQKLSLNAHAFTIVGVAARGFFGTHVVGGPDMWASALMAKEDSTCFRKPRRRWPRLCKRG
jgi:hypothetical protein